MRTQSESTCPPQARKKRKVWSHDWFWRCTWSVDYVVRVSWSILVLNKAKNCSMSHLVSFSQTHEFLSQLIFKIMLNKIYRYSGGHVFVFWSLVRLKKLGNWPLWNPTGHLNTTQVYETVLSLNIYEILSTILRSIFHSKSPDRRCSLVISTALIT